MAVTWQSLIPATTGTLPGGELVHRTDPDGYPVEHCQGNKRQR